MIRATKYRQILTDSRLSLVDLHEISGVSMNTLRSLSSGRNTNPQRRTRRALAAALQFQSVILATLADQLDG